MKKISIELKYTLFLFAVTRPILTIIGICSRKILGEMHNYPLDLVFCYYKRIWLDIWGVWDSIWYLRTASEWYPLELIAGRSNYGFFPLYPLLVKMLGMIIGDNFIAAVIVSNICLITACVFLYRLVRLYLDSDIALRSIKYLFLFPTAFILSGIFSEPLFLVLAIMCFYYAKKGKWLFVGIAGFLLSLTRSNGVVILLPMLYEYLKTKHFNLRNIKRDISFLSLIPFGLFVFMGYCYYLTGDYLEYAHAKEAGWKMALGNPLENIYLSLFSKSIPLVFNAVFAIIVIMVLLLFCKKIGFSYWLYGMLSIFIPLIYGVGKVGSAVTIRPVVGSMTGTTRFALVIFPFYILFARWGRHRYIDQIFTILLSILQGFLMVFWAAGFELVV